jgi:hypothetical protein
MHYRLGEYQCDSCPGTRVRHAQPVDHSTEAAAFPTTPPYYSSVEHSAGTSYLYDGGERRRREKVLFFTIYCVWQAAIILNIFFTVQAVFSKIAAIGGSSYPHIALFLNMQPGNMNLIVAGMMIGLCVSALTTIFILRWIIFGVTTWAKSGCLTYVVLTLMIFIWQFIGLYSPSSNVWQYLPDSSLLRIAHILLGSMQIACDGWLITILYRDIAQR